MAWSGHRACKAGHLGHIAYHLGVAALSLPPPARGHAAARMARARWRAAPALQPARRRQLPGAARSSRARGMLRLSSIHGEAHNNRDLPRFHNNPPPEEGGGVIKKKKKGRAFSLFSFSPQPSIQSKEQSLIFCLPTWQA